MDINIIKITRNKCCKIEPRLVEGSDKRDRMESAVASWKEEVALERKAAALGCQKDAAVRGNGKG